MGRGISITSCYENQQGLHWVRQRATAIPGILSKGLHVDLPLMNSLALISSAEAAAQKAQGQKARRGTEFSGLQGEGWRGRSLRHFVLLLSPPQPKPAGGHHCSFAVPSPNPACRYRGVSSVSLHQTRPTQLVHRLKPLSTADTYKLMALAHAADF